MDKEKLKQRAKEDFSRIYGNAKAKLDSIDWKEKRKRIQAFFKKTGKALYKQFMKLPKRVRRDVMIAILLAGSAGVLKVAYDVKKVVDVHKQKVEQERQQRLFKDKLEQKYQITDKASFQKLYEDALPLIQVSMLPTECLILDPYSDNGKAVSNTIGLGSYWYPKNGNPKSSEWIYASQHFEEQGAHRIAAELAFDLADGWYRYREAGRVFKNMYKMLEGTELNVHEFAAIATVMYNSEKSGAELCKFVKENYKDEKKCAQKIVSLHANSKKFKGLPKRHLHEAYLYLNYDNYTDKMYDFFVRTGKNSRGKFYAQTSVTQLSDEDTKAGIEAVLSGDESKIIEEQQKISSYICKGGQTVREIIHENVINENYSISLLAFLSPENRDISLESAINLSNASMAEQQYKDALAIYEKALDLEKKGKKEKSQKEFAKALKGFEAIIEGGHQGADLHNDIAITCYHLGDYERCIEESKLVLKSGETDLYDAAHFNMGIATKKLKNNASFGNANQETGASSEIEQYQKAVETYDNALDLELKGKKDKSQKEFAKALEGFEAIVKNGYEGADLHNDIAITCYHLGDYERCIEESRLVLKSGETDCYATANFNAAIAYEKLGNFDGALRNYEAYGKNGGDSTRFQHRINDLKVLKAQVSSAGISR